MWPSTAFRMRECSSFGEVLLMRYKSASAAGDRDAAEKETLSFLPGMGRATPSFLLFGLFIVVDSDVGRFMKVEARMV